MTLKKLLDQGKLRQHKTSKEEISNLTAIVKRDLKDAGIKALSADRRFATAYNAALQAATMVLYASGYKTHGIGHHFAVFEAVKGIMGKEYHGLFEYFDSCRSKRNRTDYDFAGSVTDTEAEELISEAEKFSKIVFLWIKEKFK
jgi:uncharacterized protein (UPF0332 family)